jgi:hypothetical protein
MGILGERDRDSGMKSNALIRHEAEQSINTSHLSGN